MGLPTILYNRWSAELRGTLSCQQRMGSLSTSCSTCQARAMVQLLFQQDMLLGLRCLLHHRYNRAYCNCIGESLLLICAVSFAGSSTAHRFPG